MNKKPIVFDTTVFDLVKELPMPLDIIDYVLHDFLFIPGIRIKEKFDKVMAELLTDKIDIPLLNTYHQRMVFRKSKIDGYFRKRRLREAGVWQLITDLPWRETLLRFDTFRVISEIRSNTFLDVDEKNCFWSSGYGQTFPFKEAPLCFRPAVLQMEREAQAEFELFLRHEPSLELENLARRPPVRLDFSLWPRERMVEPRI
jgi:hypothetical protein